MAKFFVDRPIVAIVISILMVLLGLVAMVQLPVALYPNIAPPEILVQATYVGADALTIEEAVATPIEAQMTGVDNMLYMYSTSTGGQMSLRVAFDVSTDPSTDEVLAQMRYSQAASQLPPQVTTQGVTVKKSTSSPLAIFALYSPKGTYNPLFISNYAYVNAMEEVSGPVVAIALILVAVFVPTAFIPGITGRMYQQFAVTIAVSVIISAFNALTLSPALAALLLRPRKPMRGPLGAFFRGFNRWFGRATDGYVATSAVLIRKAALSMLFLAVVAVLAGLVGYRLPAGFIPQEDQGYMSLNVQLPPAASMQRTAAVCDQIDAMLKDTPGIRNFTVVIGETTTNTAQYFLTLDDWAKRDPKGLTADAIILSLNKRLSALPDAQAFAVPPPAIPGVGTSGGISFMLEEPCG